MCGEWKQKPVKRTRKRKKGKWRREEVKQRNNKINNEQCKINVHKMNYYFKFGMCVCVRCGPI